jgi:hypothetical protein
VALGRLEHLKWSLAFWIGQLAAMAGLLALSFTPRVGRSWPDDVGVNESVTVNGG